MTNYYKILGVRNFASDEEFKIAYRKLSQKLHPDKNDGDPFFTEKFKELQEAYENLSTSDKKSRYDMKLREYLAGADANRAYTNTANNAGKGEAKNTGTTQQGSNTSGSSTAKSKPAPDNKPSEGKDSVRSVVYGVIVLFAVGLILSIYISKNRESGEAFSSSLSPDTVSYSSYDAVDSVSSKETDQDLSNESKPGNTTLPRPEDGKVEKSLVSGEIKDNESTDYVNPGSDYFTVGSNKQKVLQVQGNPSRTRLPYGTTEEWTYDDGSSVTFEDGKVKEFNNYKNGLKVRLIDEGTRTSGSTDYFTVGSNKQKVLQVQGNPSRIRLPYGTTEEWTYDDGSNVTFEDGKVKEFNNYNDGLKVKLIDESTRTSGSTDYFTVGSTKQKVLQVQGNPMRIRRPYGTTEEWTYAGGSSVTFENGKVKEFNNYKDGLKVKL